MPKRRFYRLRDLPRLAGVSESTIQRMVREGGFPAPLRLSARRVAWTAEMIAAWLDSRAQQQEAAR